MSNKENVLRQLDTLGIPYVCYDHPAAYTMQDCYELPFVTPELLFCKNLPRRAALTRLYRFALFNCPGHKISLLLSF